jgi:hypothetical protein
LEADMKKLIFWTAACFCAAQAIADVPPARLRGPDVPGFLQSMEFQTVQMQVFPAEASGMIPDAVSDLMWNPAFLAGLAKRYAYLDFHSMNQNPLFASRGSGIQAVNFRSAMDDQLAPRWYPQTSIHSVQTTPLYDFGILLPVGPKVSVAVFNSAVFDYGPYLQAMGGGGGALDEKADLNSRLPGGGNLVPQRVEADENQQTVLGNRLEASVAIRISQTLDLGVRLGHMVFDRHGDLLNDRWATYPHSSFGDLEDESLKIRGHQIEAGAGLVFRPDSTIRFGLYGGIASGDGRESSASLDTTRTWSETDVDPRYYSKNYYFLQSGQTFKETGSRPQIALTFEKRLSEKWLFRSFAQASWTDVDVTGALAASDTSASDRTYDQWDYNTTYFQRMQGHGSRSSDFAGDGTEKTRLFKGFVSAVYEPNGDWSLFGGLHVQRYTFNQDFTETSHLRSNNFSETSIYKPETNRDASAQEKLYHVTADFDRWSLWIPAGFRIRVAGGLSVLLGSGIAFSLDHENTEGQRLYPYINTAKWKNGTQILDDRQVDRYELFSSKPAKMLNRQWGRYFGLVYSHPSGAKAYLRFGDDFSQTANWAFGFGMDW